MVRQVALGGAWGTILVDDQAGREGATGLRPGGRRFSAEGVRCSPGR